ncbi:MAG: DUF21 domain-containing protein [Phycisphaerae bacterium]|nr:DUF21 domain-containing protein [Phycisphaerae bacterium]
MTAPSSEILTWVAWIAVFVVSVLAGAFYAGIETGIYVLNKIRLDLAAESGDRSAILLRRHLRNPNNLLTVLLVGTNISGYVATFAVTTMFVLGGYGESAEWLTLAAATPVLFIFRESVPKNVFQRLGEKLTYRLGWVLGASSVLLNACGLAPLVKGFAWGLMRLSRSPDRRGGAGQTLPARLVAEGYASGVLTQSQSRMADRVMRIGHVTLGDVMIPMDKVVQAPQDAGREQLLELIREQNYSHLPLLNQDGKVVGILDTYDVLADETKTAPSNLAAAPVVLDASLTVTDALYRMQAARAVIAVVQDDGGKDVGIVTIKDLIEQIVGELTDW